MMLIIEEKIKQLERELEIRQAQIIFLNQLLSERDLELGGAKAQLSLAMADRTYVVQGFS